MRAFLLSALVASTAMAQQLPRFQRTNQRTPQGRGNRGLLGDSGAAAAAFFEFASTSGTGMGTACACTTPTGSNGETITFTRTGSATCSRQGLSNTGIANGDLVTCSGNQPRVEPSGGVLGLRVESSRTNVALQSEDFSSASWGVVGSVTVTANNSTSPANTTTADRVQFAATAVNQEAILQQTAAPVGASSCSVYARMTSGTGTLPMALNLGGTYACASCSITSASWTRCTISGTVVSNGNWILGNESFAGICFGALPALDVQLWGAQCESGAYETSYIATTSAAVTRNAETATAALSTSQQTQCQAATVELGTGAANDRIWLMSRALAGSGDFIASYTQAAARSDAVGSAAISATSGGSAFSGSNRFVTRWTGSQLTIFRNGSQTATVSGASTLANATILGIGSSPAGASNLDGIVSRVQIDPNSTVCQ